MAHDVFISHAHKDKGIADAICEKLESARVRCWIAERDITAGDNWTEATRNAIESSRVIVLVLSENANASAHIEREIAHAFYAGRQIIPLRLSNAPPKRDFLFYLGNVRWLDAFGSPAEQHMEALTESVHGIVRGANATRPTLPAPPERQPGARFDFSDSWIGSLQASHYQTLGILKPVAVAASLVAVGWLLWLAFGQPKQEIPAPTTNRQAMFPDPEAARNATSPANGEAPATNPAYVYSRFGLWVKPDPASKPSGQHPPLGLPTPPSREQAVSAAPSPLPDGDQSQAAEAEAENPGLREEANGRPPEGRRSRIANRQEARRKKARPKHHSRKVQESEGSFARHIKHGLKRVWHDIAGQNQ